MKAIETIRRHPFLTATTAAILGIAALEAVGWTTHPLYDDKKEVNRCYSPWTVSDSYVDPGASLVFQTWGGIRTTGLIASGKVAAAPGVRGIQASFKAPDAPEATWETNVSQMVKPDSQGNYSLKLAIGKGSVHFAVRTVATNGSTECTTPPAVTFTHVDAHGYRESQAQLPWRNPVNVVTDLF